MDDKKFRAAYSKARNGANYMVRHPLARRFLYSDGVQECAEAGCYWLLDILATEAVKPVLGAGGPCMLDVSVVRGNATLSLTDADEKPPIFKKTGISTDMPEGKWLFYLSTDDGQTVVCILPSEY